MHRCMPTNTAILIVIDSGRRLQLQIDKHFMHTTSIYNTYRIATAIYVYGVKRKKYCVATGEVHAFFECVHERQ